MSSKSPGGSSGGEGALIAAGGSLLGLGTDIGGSIRFPSAFCGICGIKPTGNRIRYGVGGGWRDLPSPLLCDLGLAPPPTSLGSRQGSPSWVSAGRWCHSTTVPGSLVSKVVGAQSCCADEGLGRGWPFPVSNVLCFLSSKSGLKGSVYGQVAGEVCGSFGALEEGGWPDPPRPLPLLGPRPSSCLDPAPEPLGAG